MHTPHFWNHFWNQPQNWPVSSTVNSPIVSVLVLCFMANYRKYIHFNLTMFGARSLAKLCLSKSNVFSNVLTLKMNQCLQWLNRNIGGTSDVKPNLHKVSTMCSEINVSSILSVDPSDPVKSHFTTDHVSRMGPLNPGTEARGDIMAMKWLRTDGRRLRVKW